MQSVKTANLALVALLTVTLTAAIETPSKASEVSELLKKHDGLRYNASLHKFYMYVNGARTWNAAKQHADGIKIKGVGGTLVATRSSSEEAFVAKMLRDEGAAAVWYGGTDQDQEGHWRWVDTQERFYDRANPSEGGFRNWLSGRPRNNASINSLLAIRSGSTTTWQDAPHTNTSVSGYVAQWYGDEMGVDNSSDNTKDSDVVYFSRTDKYYRWIAGNYQWPAAKRLAEQQIYRGVNGRLVEIYSGPENAFVRKLARRKERDSIWLGGSDSEREGRWIWVGSKIHFSNQGRRVGGRYQNWNRGEPQNGGSGDRAWGDKFGEDYTRMVMYNGKWTDRSTLQRFSFVVEWNGRAVRNSNVYYVRKSGDDSNTGKSPDQAWKTLSRAARQNVPAGSRIYVGAGIYNSGGTYVNVLHEGEPRRPIRWIADTSGRYTGDRGRVTLLSDNWVGLHLSGKNHVEFDGFYFTRSDHVKKLDAQARKQGSRYLYLAAYPYESIGIAFRNCHFHDCDRGVYAQPKWDRRNLGSEVIVDNCTFTDNDYAGVAAWRSHVTVSNSTFENNGQYAIFNYSNPYKRQEFTDSRLVVSDCQISGGSKGTTYGIYSLRCNVAISNVTATGCQYGTYNRGYYYSDDRGRKQNGEKEDIGSVRITKSQFNENRILGVYLEAVPASTIRQVQCNDNTAYGCYIWNYNRHDRKKHYRASYSNIEAKRNGAYGYIHGYGKATLKNCVFDNNKYVGLYAYDVRLRLEKTHIRKNKSCGLYANRADFTVDDTPLDGNGYGMWIQGYAGLAKKKRQIADAVVDNVRITNSTYGAIYSSWANLTVKNSTLVNNGDNGILGYMGNITLTNNRISGQRNYGVYAWSYAYYAPYQRYMTPKKRFYGDSLRKTTKSKRRFHELVVKNCQITKCGYSGVTGHYLDVVVQDTNIQMAKVKDYQGHYGYLGYTNKNCDTNVTFKNVTVSNAYKNGIMPYCQNEASMDVAVMDTNIKKARSYGIYCYYTPKFKVARCKVEDSGHGIGCWGRYGKNYTLTGSNAQITQTKLNGNLTGIYAWATHLTTNAVELLDNRTCGLRMQNCDPPILKNTDINNNGYNIIFQANVNQDRPKLQLADRTMHSTKYWNVYTSHTDLTLDNVHLTNDGSGGVVCLRGDATIQNSSTDGGSYGFYHYARRRDGKLAKTKIVKSDIRNAKAYGVYSYWAARLDVVDSNLEGNNYGLVTYGDWTSEPLESIQLVNTEIQNNNRGIHSIYNQLILDSCDNIKGNKSVAVYSAYGDETLKNMTGIQDNGYNLYLIGYSDREAARNEFADLDFSRARYYGFTSYYYNTLLENCTFNECGAYGLVSVGGDLEARDCELTGSRGKGGYSYAWHYPEKKSGKTTLVSTTATKNGSWAFLTYQSDLTMTDCTISNNGAGVYNYRHMTNTPVTSSLIDTTTFTGNGHYALINYNNHLTMRNCQVSGNKLHGAHSYSWFADSTLPQTDIQNCRFDSNGGYGLINRRSDLVMKNCSLSRNGSRGHGLYSHNLRLDKSIGSANISDCRLDSNANWGAMTYYSHASFTNCSFSGCGNGVYNYGYDQNPNNYAGSLTLNNCNMSNNSGHGALGQYNQSFVVQNSTASRNGSYGLYNRWSHDMRVDNTTVARNSVWGFISYTRDDVLIRNSLITDNGYGAYLYGTATGQNRLWNVTLANNGSTYNLYQYNGNLDLHNSIVSSSRGAGYGLLRVGSGQMNRSHNLIYGHETDLYRTRLAETEIVADPLFADPANGNYHATKFSKMINAGTNMAQVAFDMDGVQRPIEHTSDIGAYEYPSELGIRGIREWTEAARPLAAN